VCPRSEHEALITLTETNDWISFGARGFCTKYNKIFCNCHNTKLGRSRALNTCFQNGHLNLQYGDSNQQISTCKYKEEVLEYVVIALAALVLIFIVVMIVLFCMLKKVKDTVEQEKTRNIINRFVESSGEPINNEAIIATINDTEYEIPLPSYSECYETDQTINEVAVDLKTCENGSVTYVERIGEEKVSYRSISDGSDGMYHIVT
jgi:hypothetical protein